jgi:DNA-binding beta-propeller fold protein YncE
MSKHRICRRTPAAIVLILAAAGAVSAVAVAQPPFLPRLINSSTIPANMDENPYGVAFVPAGFPSGGAIDSGDVLVSNFNNSSNIQGTGTTIVRLRPRGSLAPPGTAVTFFTSKLELRGLSTALGVLRGGFVVVGNVPTTDGTFKTIGQGALQVIDRNGNWVQTLTDKSFLDGPWDLALADDGSEAHIFVSSVLNGTVSRLDVAVSAEGLTVQHKTFLATGYTHVPNVSAVVLGPTGLALDANTDTLYVASTADNAIYAIENAIYADAPVDRGQLVFSDPHLRGPLALKFAPNGDLLTANGDAVNIDPLHPSEIVEFTAAGQFIREFNVDATEGGAFGIDTVAAPDAPFNFAYIDDVTNNLVVVRLPGARYPDQQVP